MSKEKLEKKRKRVPEKINRQRAPKATTLITLDAVALVISLVLVAKEEGAVRFLTNTYHSVQSSPGVLASLPQNDVLKQEVVTTLRAKFDEAAMFASLAPTIHKYLHRDSAEDTVSTCYLIVRLVRNGIARPSPQSNAAIWEEAWGMANKKKLVKEKRSLLIKNHLAIENWKRQVMGPAERKFLRMINQFKNSQAKAKAIRRKLDDLFPQNT